MNSSRSSASPTSASGPATAIHPSFTCGSPTDFDSPPSDERPATVRRVQHAAGGRRRARLELVVGEHFVGDDRDALRGAQSAARRVELVLASRTSRSGCSG